MRRNGARERLGTVPAFEQRYDPSLARPVRDIHDNAGHRAVTLLRDTHLPERVQRVRLESLNRSQPPVFANKVTIIGLVVGVIRQF